jgi:hypothetical protein
VRAARGAAGGDLSSFEHLSGEDLSNAPALAELLPSFAEIDVDEIFSVTAEHLLDGLGRSLKARQAERPQTRRASKR